MLLATRAASAAAAEAKRAHVRQLAQMKPSEWMKAQPAFLGAQGKTVLDPDFDLDDGGLPRERPALPAP